MSDSPLFNKVKAVIESCTTAEQMESAYRYLRLYLNAETDLSAFRKAIECYNKKIEQFND